jgi:hypothetical protein
VSLYGLVRNNTINLVDYFGLSEKKCTEAIGKDGQSRIVFDIAPPRGGWKIVSLDFSKQGSAQSQLIDKITIAWEAKVAVLCTCTPCNEIRHGVRVYENVAAGAWLTADPTQLPLSPFPVAVNVAAIIGGFIADEILGSLAIPIPADRPTGQDIVRAIRGLVAGGPTQPNDGQWKDGKSPCSK